MIECCQNCRFFDAANETCLNHALRVEHNLGYRIYDLLESGKIHELVREIVCESDNEIVENDIAEEIAAFFEENLDDDAHVHIVDPQTFRCNQYA